MKRTASSSFANPAPLTDGEVLDTLQRQQRPMRLDDLLRVMDLPRKSKKALQGHLESLAARHLILKLRGGSWVHNSQVKTAEGTVAVLRSGAGFVTPDKASGLPEVFVRQDDMGGAWPGDRVEIMLLPGSLSRATATRAPEGRIVRVVERRQSEIIVFATRNTTARGLLCRPTDARLDFVVDVDTSSLDSRPEPGTLLSVRMLDRDESGLWRAEAISIMGREQDARVQEALVKINHQIPMEFPESVLRQAEGLLADRPRDGSRVADGREDLRHIDFVTIDGCDARDFDDAVHVRPKDGGWILHVAIADVSWFVRPNTALDREALERGNSCYFPLSVEPMLPEALSNDLCSLRPDEDRFVLAASLDIDSQGRVKESRFMSGVIRSRARLTYEQVQHVLDRPVETGPDDAGGAVLTAGLREMLLQAAELARTLRAARMRRGALDMDIPEPAYEVNKAGRVLAIRKAITLFSHQLIEECMLAANEAVARFLEAKGLPFPARVHPEPDPDRLESLFATLRAASLPPNLMALIPDKPRASAIKPLLDASRGTPQAFIVSRLVLRSMMQARYQPEMAGHYGLASQAYCHFTSPIRRYADLVVHRSLRLALGQSVGAVPARHKLLAVTDQCNVRERSAQEAERETTRRMACLLLADRLGERFEGVVSGVIDFGFFVELAYMPVEGMVRVATLDDDWYAFDPDRSELLGQATGRVFRLGQPVTVRLDKADLGRLEIDLSLIEGGSREARPARKKPNLPKSRPRPTGKRRRPRGKQPAEKVRPGRKNPPPANGASDPGWPRRA